MIRATFRLIGGPRAGERITFDANARWVAFDDGPPMPLRPIFELCVPEPRRLGRYIFRLDCTGRFAWVDGEWVADWQGSKPEKIWIEAMQFRCPCGFLCQELIESRSRRIRIVCLGCRFERWVALCPVDAI